MKANGSPPPRFETDEARTYFLAEIQIHPAFIGKAHDEAHDEAHEEELSDTERRILATLRKGPKSVPEIANALKQQSRSGHFKKALGRLSDLGMIAFTIPGNLEAFKRSLAGVPARIPKGVMCRLSALRVHGADARAPFELKMPSKVTI